MEQNNQSIKDAVHVGQSFLKQYDNSDKANKCWHLYDALLALTANDLANNLDNKDCKYDYQELYTYISENNDGYKPTSDPQRQVRTLYRELEKKLAETPQEHVAKELGLTIKPKITKDSTVGRGHKATIWIEAETLNTQESKPAVIHTGQLPSEAQPEKTIQQIEYYLEKTPTLPLWSRWAQDADLKGWKKVIFILLALIPSTLLITLIITLIVSPILIPSIILYFTVAISTYYLLFGSILKAFKNNIAIVPDTMLPLRLHSAVFELDINQNPNKIGQRIKKLSIKVYSAKCPNCGSKVHLRKGGLAHWGRIIGECDLNPVEHIYSFDHTNLTGRSIR